MVKLSTLFWRSLTSRNEVDNDIGWEMFVLLDQPWGRLNRRKVASKVTDNPCLVFFWGKEVCMAGAFQLDVWICVCILFLICEF